LSVKSGTKVVGRKKNCETNSSDRWEPGLGTRVEVVPKNRVGSLGERKGGFFHGDPLGLGGSSRR